MTRSSACRITTWAAACLLATGLASCGEETEAPSASRGSVVGGLADSIDGTSATVTLPTGTVTLTVGQPVDSVDAEESRDAKTHQAPSGSSFLPVHVDFDESRAPWSGLLAQHPEEASITVRVGSQDWQLGSPYDVSGKAVADSPESTFYLPADGRPSADDVTYDVSYAGRSLDIAMTGEAGDEDPLAALSAHQPDAVTCPSDGWTASRGMEATVACNISWAGRTPYWPGQGWAEDGEWQVIRVARLQVTELTSSTGDGQRITTATDATTAGQGARPVTTLEVAPAQPDRLVGTLVLRATPGEPLTVDLATALDVRSESGDPQEVTVSRTTSLR